MQGTTAKVISLLALADCEGVAIKRKYPEPGRFEEVPRMVRGKEAHPSGKGGEMETGNRD